MAGFLGVSNLLSATRDGTDGAFVMCRLADGAFVRAPAAAVDGKPVFKVGVRPEKIRLHADAAAIPAGLNRIEGRVVDASYLGASTSYIIESTAGQRLTVFEQNVERTSHGSLHRPGEEVALAWSPEHTFAVEGAAEQPGPARAGS